MSVSCLQSPSGYPAPLGINPALAMSHRSLKDPALPTHLIFSLLLSSFTVFETYWLFFYLKHIKFKDFYTCCFYSTWDALLLNFCMTSSFLLLTQIYPTQEAAGAELSKTAPSILGHSLSPLHYFIFLGALITFWIMLIIYSLSYCLFLPFKYKHHENRDLIVI